MLERGDTAFVQGPYYESEVGVFDLKGVKYLRTYFDDDYWDDSLLWLPTF